MNIKNSNSKSLSAQLNSTKVQRPPDASKGEEREQSNSTLKMAEQHSQVFSSERSDRIVKAARVLAEYASTNTGQSYTEGKDDYYERPNGAVLDAWKDNPNTVVTDERGNVTIYDEDGRPVGGGIVYFPPGQDHA